MAERPAIEKPTGSEVISSLAAKMKGASYFEWEGDPTATEGWTVIGEDHSGELALVDYDSFSGATSQPLKDGVLARWLMPEDKAKELHDRICVMDETYWPGFNPTVVRIENGRIVERLTPPSSSASSAQEEGQSGS